MILLFAGAGNALIDAPMATAAADTLSTGLLNWTIDAPLVTATADAPTPTVAANVTLDAPMATAAGAANAPSVLITVDVPSATATADALIPTEIHVQAVIEAPIARAIAVGLNDGLTGPTLQGTYGTGSSHRAIAAAIGSLGGTFGIGEVEHMIVSRSGEVDYPIVGEWECTEEIPGGFWSATGLIAKSTRKTALGVYREGSKWLTFHAQTGDLIWEGRLKHPKQEEGQVRLDADGIGKLFAERPIRHRMLYQTWDLSEWQSNAAGAPFSQDPGNTLDTQGDSGMLTDWNVDISGSIMFARPKRTIDIAADGPNPSSSSEIVSFFADDLAEPGITRLRFNLHMNADFNISYHGQASFQHPPFPPWMIILSGRWDPRLSISSQGGLTRAVTWYPDWNASGQWGSELIDQWQHWVVHMGYSGGDWDYTSSGGVYPVKPYAYSDEIGARAYLEVPSVGALTQEYQNTPGIGRRWDNRPFTRTAIGSITDWWFGSQSANFPDPGASVINDYAGPSPGSGNDYWDNWPNNYIGIQWNDEADVSGTDAQKVGRMHAEHTDVRVNGIAAGDHFSATELVLDVCRRRGLGTQRVGRNGINVLPYDLKEGNWGDILDHAALLSGYQWRITSDPEQGRRQLEFNRWGRLGEWIVDDDRAPFRMSPVQRFNSVDVAFKYPRKAGGLEGVAHIKHKDHVPGGDHAYGRVALDQPLHDREQAEIFGKHLVNQLRRRRWAGDGSCATVRTANGVRESSYLVKAGDVIVHMPSGHRGRIQSIRKSYGQVEFTFADSSSNVDAIIARKNLRMSTNQSA